MSAPGIITGGHWRDIFSRPGGVVEDVLQDLRRPQGIFSPNPGATPKYAYNDPGRRRDAEYRETMARLFVEIPAADKQLFLQSIAPESRILGEALMSGGPTGGAGGTGFVDFLLTEAQEAFNEKVQIVDTLTDNYVVFFSGREPTMASYAGTLMNTYQDDQRVWFLRAYSEILRGTRLAQRNLIARLRYDSFLASGYLMNLNLWLDGETDITAARFSFQMIVKRLQVMTPALGFPTGTAPVETASRVHPAVEELLQTAREGVVTPERPPTAIQGPAAESEENLASAMPTRDELRFRGLDEMQINNVLAAAQRQRRSPEIDPRERMHAQAQQGVERVSQHAANNTENKQNDGMSGTTNVTAGALSGTSKFIFNGTGPYASGSSSQPLILSEVSSGQLIKTSGLRRRGAAA